MKRNRTVATLLAVTMVFSVVAPMLGFIPMTASAQPVYNNTTDENESSPYTSDNVTVENGNIQITRLDRTVIDNFSDGNLDEYSGNTPDASIVNPPIFGNTNTLELTSDGTNIFIGDENSNLSAYPGPGDTFETEVYHTAGHNVSSVWFGVKGVTTGQPDEGYQVEINLDNSNPDLAIWKKSDTESSRIGTSFIEGNYSETKVKWQVHWGTDGDINATLMYANNSSVIGKVNATDTTYTDGGIGYKVWDETPDSSAYYNNFTVLGDLESNSGEVIYRYNTTKKAQKANLDWEVSSEGSVQQEIRAGDGDWVDVSNSDGVWTDLSGDEDIYVKFDLIADGWRSPRVNSFDLEYRTYNTGIYENVSVRVARESPNSALRYFDPVGSNQNISDVFTIRTSEDANLTVEEFNTEVNEPGENLSSFTVDMDSGRMNVTIEEVPNGTYDVYQDNEIYRDNVSVDNGTLSVTKTDNWSTHSFQVVRTNPGSSNGDDSDGVIPTTGCDSSRIFGICIGGFSLPVVVGTILVVTIGILVITKVRGEK